MSMPRVATDQALEERTFPRAQVQGFASLVVR